MPCQLRKRFSWPINTAPLRQQDSLAYRRAMIGRFTLTEGGNSRLKGHSVPTSVRRRPADATLTLIRCCASGVCRRPEVSRP